MRGVHKTSSICYKRTDTPRAFHECTSNNDTCCFVKNEIQAIETGLGYMRGIELQTAVAGFIDRAKKGRLLEMQEKEYDTLAVSCASQPDIWELRIECSGLLYRLYYSEDEKRDPEFVALAFQKKDIIGKSEEDIKAEQNQIMKRAQDRYTLYAHRKWGHTAVDCHYCI